MAGSDGRIVAGGGKAFCRGPIDSKMAGYECRAAIPDRRGSADLHRERGPAEGRPGGRGLLNEKGIRAVINNNEALAAASLNGTQTMPLRAMIVFKSVGVHVAADALALASLADAQRVLRYYIRRWECEEGMQFLKEQVNLESIRTFRWSAICRLVLLCVLVMIYLAWLIEEHPRLTDRLIEYGQVLPDEGDFLFYRLLTGVTEAINVCFYLRRDLL